MARDCYVMAPALPWPEPSKGAAPKCRLISQRLQRLCSGEWVGLFDDIQVPAVRQAHAPSGVVTSATAGLG